MKYFFSSSGSLYPRLKELGAKNYLLSFAVDAKKCKSMLDENLIIDSGAFSVWRSGKVVDVDDYLNFCKELPKNWTFINLDVIPPKGASKVEVEKCCTEGYENYLYLKKHLKNVMPVYHQGEDFNWMLKFMDHTDYIGIGFGNERGEPSRRKLFSKIFGVTGLNYKIHGLGYSPPEGLRLFPFYSVDGTSYKTIHDLNGSGTNFWIETKNLDYYARVKINQFLKLEKEITELWEWRGVKWN